MNSVASSVPHPPTTTTPLAPTRRSDITRWLVKTPLLAYRLGLAEPLDMLHLLVLSTTRSSGITRHTALEYRAHGNRLYVISTRGDRAGWAVNAIAQPAVTVQRGGKTFAACMERVTHTGEALMALRLFHGTGPFVYDTVFTPMQSLRGRDAVTERDLPRITAQYAIFRIIPQPDMPLPLSPLADDLRWVLPVAGLATVALGALAALAFAVRGWSRRGDQLG
ncbi:MAG: nitroreductase family deazaflavin-dependent oxidoreductase [Pleurocapsa minor GSE-CHR-MK-17-07R]|jgi:deazaflavin-dependent oxidoreductase (nitroreductase family)|nr:nitroreductase family deazaflavin-dependent oxidoreductase [Pleurocapsa minor GSE-CHR-MK 17-07R]